MRAEVQTRCDDLGIGPGSALQLAREASEDLDLHSTDFLLPAGEAELENWLSRLEQDWEWFCGLQ